MKTLSFFLAVAIGPFGSILLAQDPLAPAPDLPGKVIPATPLTPKPIPGIEAGEGEKEAKETISPEVENALRFAIRENLKAWNDKSLNMLRSTTHSESPLLETSDLMARYIFDRYKLKYTPTKVTVLSAEEDEAEVEVHQTTELVEGPSFRNNRSVVVHTLKKENGKWKLWSSEIKLLQFLE
ncbi:MAG: hypothetical protein VB980_00900 [Opitutales bacterium]|jgi:hypothetical protein